MNKKFEIGRFIGYGRGNAVPFSSYNEENLRYVFDTKQNNQFLHGDGKLTGNAYVNCPLQSNGSWNIINEENFKKYLPKLYLSLYCKEEVKTKAFEKNRYVGNIVNGAVEAFHGGRNGSYVFDIVNKDELFFVYANGTKTKISGYTYDYITTHPKWEFIGERAFKKWLPKVYMERYGNNVTKPKAIAIRVGALYYNNSTSRVERVISVQDKVMVWTSVKKANCVPYPKAAFRIATKDEVNDYLGNFNYVILK